MAAQNSQFDFDFIVMGSGFGGSVSALRLAEKGYRVAVIEMGRRRKPSELPRTSWSIHRWFWHLKVGLRGFFNMRLFGHVTIFHRCAAVDRSPPPVLCWRLPRKCGSPALGRA
jgi:cholesterol oxidase